MSKLLSFYESLITYCGLKVNPSNGAVYSDSTGKKIPIMVEEKELTLPYASVLSSANIGEKFVFHPIPEHIARGESPIIKKLLHILSIQINAKATNLFLIILTILHDSKSFKKLTPDQLSLLGHVGSIDKTGLTNLHRLIVNALKKDASRSLVKIFLRKGAVINETRYSRGGIVTFPLSEEFDSVTEVKLRDKDTQAFNSIMEIIFPEFRVKNKYSRGSNNDYIPYLEALLLSSLTLVDKINTLIELFPEQSADMDMEVFDVDFVDYLNDNALDLVQEAKRIPAQPGNIADHGMAPVAPQAMNQPMTQPLTNAPANAGIVNPDNTVDIGRLYMSKMGMVPGMPGGAPVIGNIRNSGMLHPQQQMGMYTPMMPMMPGQVPGYNPMMPMVPGQMGMYNPMMPNQMPSMPTNQPVMPQPQTQRPMSSSGRAKF